MLFKVYLRRKIQHCQINKVFVKKVQKINQTKSHNNSYHIDLVSLQEFYKIL